MKRRKVVQGLLLGGGLLGSMGHTPYRQWQVYRARHLMIGTSREDEPTYPLGKEIAAVLLAHLPESSARVTRATTVYRLGSLISTDQIRVLLLSESDARDMAAGRGAFDDLGPVPIRLLYRFGQHLLVSRADFPDYHAWLLARTLADFANDLPGAAPPRAEMAPVPIHPGALAALYGGPEPDAPEKQADTITDDHDHR